MNKIGKKLAELRIKINLSQPELAELLSNINIPSTAQKISKWETDYSIPNAYQFLALCNIFNIRDVLECFNISENPSHSLNELGQQRLAEYIELLVSSERYNNSSSVLSFSRKIKLFTLPASAGTGQFLDSDYFELIDADSSLPDSADFGIRLSGNSMEPKYKDGQIIWVHRQNTLSDGEIGVFSFDNNAYCKKISISSSGTKLISLNPDYPPIDIPRNASLHVFGKVVGKA